MNKIFWGLLFLLIDIKLGGLSITPSFVGYTLIYLGMKEMGAPETFRRAKPWVVVGIIWTILFWLPIFTGDGNIIISLIGTAIHVWITYLIVQAVKELGRVEPEAESLRKSWVVMAVLEAATVLLMWVEGLALIAMLASFVATIVYIVMFHRCKKALQY